MNTTTKIVGGGTLALVTAGIGGGATVLYNQHTALEAERAQRVALQEEVKEVKRTFGEVIGEERTQREFSVEEQRKLHEAMFKSMRDNAAREKEELSGRLDKTEGANRDLGDRLEELKKRNQELEESNKLEAERLAKAEDLVKGVVSENDELAKKLVEALETQAKLSKQVDSKVDSNELRELVKKVMPSVVMFKSGKEGWSGIILKIDGKRYFASCGHFGNGNVYNFINAMDVKGALGRGYEISFLQGKGKVTMPAFPLENGKVGFLPPAQGDFTIIPVPEELDEKVFNKVEKESGVPIGLELEDIDKAPQIGEKLINIGNPFQNSFSLGLRILSAPERVVKRAEDGPLLCDYQFFPGPSPGESGSALIRVRDGKPKVVAIVTRQEGPHVGNSTSYQQIKYDLDTAFGIKGVVTDEEKKHPDWDWYVKNVKPKKAFTVEELSAVSRLSLSLGSAPLTGGGLPLGMLLPPREEKKK